MTVPTPNQMKILEYLRGREASYQYAIERDLEFLPGMASGYLMRMFVLGWIEECEAPDPKERDGRGKKYYRITAVGRGVLEE